MAENQTDVFDVHQFDEEPITPPPRSCRPDLKLPSKENLADSAATAACPQGLISDEATGNDKFVLHLNHLKEVLLRKMDAQEILLNVLLRGAYGAYHSSGGDDSETVVSEMPQEWQNSKGGPEEEEEEEEEEAETPGPIPKQRTRPSFTPALFSTFSAYDMALQENTNEREGIRSRAMFALRSARASEKGLCRAIVKNSFFDMFCACMVVSNCIYLGIEVEMSIHQPTLPMGMVVTGYVYAFWFLLELLLRVGADGCCRYFAGPDWMWSLLDLVVVTTSLWEVAADLITAVSVGEVASMSGLKAFRIIRLTRVLKVVRLMRVFRFVLALRSLISSIAETLKSLFWALCLLGVIIYVFAVLFTQAVNDYVNDPDMPALPEREKQLAMRFFSSLGDTMLALFESIANGVSWNEVLAPLKLISPVWVIIYLFYIFFTYFTVLNVVTAVFCQSAVESAQNDHAAMVHSVLKNKKAHCEKLRVLFSDIGDRSGVITFKMLEERMSSQKVRAYFEVLGLDVHDAWTFFKQLDGDKRGEVRIEDFLMGCLRLRGQARAIDMGKALHDQAWLIRSQSKFQVHIASEFRKLRHEFQALASRINSKNAVAKSLSLGRSPKGSPNSKVGEGSTSLPVSPTMSLPVSH